MKYVLRLLPVLVLTIAVLFLPHFKANAQTATPTGLPVTGAYDERCLKPTQTGGHTARVNGTGLPTDRDIFIVGCVAFNDTQYCQPAKTGNTAADDQAVSGLTKLNFPVNPYPTHKLTIKDPNPTNPMRAPNGTLTVNLESVVHPSSAHSFLAVFAGTVKQTTGSASTLQYGTFQLGQDPGMCASLHWDPSGRIFDAQSLEPLPSGRITILDDKKAVVTYPVLDPLKKQLNPQPIGMDSEFNFDVLGKDPTHAYRIYYLDQVSSIFNKNNKSYNYSFPVTLSDVNPNYTKAYGCNEMTKNYPLYYDSKLPIQEADKAVTCDVPLKSTTTPYYGTPETVVNDQGQKLYWHKLINAGSTEYSGRVTHPLTKVSLVTDTGQTVAQGAADALGYWTILVENSKIPQATILNPSYTKVDLTLNQPTGMIPTFFKWLSRLFSVKSVFAQTPVVDKTVVFEPIFPYIEGYAYDKSGQILPNATVAIKLLNISAPQYQTTADDKGFFTIAPTALPSSSYYLEITPVNSTTKIDYTTSQFAKMNQQYLTSNNINLLTATKNGQSLIPTLAVSPTSAVIPTNLSNPGGLPVQSSYPLLLTVIILVLLVAAAGGIMIYIKKKESQSNNLPQQ